MSKENAGTTSLLSSRWTLLTIVFLARIGVGVQFIAVAALMTALRHDLHLDYGEIGLLLGSFMVAGVALSIPSGIIATFLGDRVTLISGLAALVIGGIIVAQSEDFYMALIGRLFGGVGAVFITVTGAKVLTDRFMGKEIATAMSFLGVAWPVGIALGISMLPFAAQWGDWRLSVHISTLLPALAAIAVIFMPLVPEQNVRHKGKTAERSTNTTTRLWSITREEFRLILVGGLAWPLMSSGGYVVFSSFAPIYLAEHGTTPETAGLIVSILSWMIVITIPLGGYIVDRTGLGDQAIWFGCLIAAASIGMVPFGGSTLFWIALSATLGFTVGAVMSLPSEILSANSRAPGMGLFYTLYYAGTSGLPALAGWLHESTGTVEITIWFSAICLILSPLSLLALRKLQPAIVPRENSIQAA